MDKLNQSALFETENEYGFPEVSSSKNFRCKDLIPFHQCKKMLAGDKDKAVSFFLDDYKFEQVWTRPRDFIRTFQYYGNIISPTFSIWSNQPYALNLFNMYRSRWCTRFYQEFGHHIEDKIFNFDSGKKIKGDNAVSVYGNTSYNEAFAESFVAYCLGIEPNRGKEYHSNFKKLMSESGLSAYEGCVKKLK